MGRLGQKAADLVGKITDAWHCGGQNKVRKIIEPSPHCMCNISECVRSEMAVAKYKISWHHSGVLALAAGSHK